ncbi:FbpB family small basic protein [Cytobacillus oceanisediminis]
MKRKLLRELVEENMKNILKDKDQLEEIYRKIDENILMETKKQRVNQ